MWNFDGGDPDATRPQPPVRPGAPPRPPGTARTEPLPPVSPAAPGARPPMYGRAPVPAHPLRRPTEEMPALSDRRRTPPLISMRAPNRAGMRKLAAGKGLSSAGLLIAFIGWGVWAAAGRGTINAPVLGFMVVLLVAVGVFFVSRLVGRFVLVRMLGRDRRTARVSHAVTGLFLAACGIYYLGQTSWIIEGIAWLQDLRTGP